MPRLTEPANLPPLPFNGTSAVFVDTTLRQTVRVTVPAQQIRIRLSNAFGGSPLPISGVSIALPAPNISSLGSPHWPYPTPSTSPSPLKLIFRSPSISNKASRALLSPRTPVHERQAGWATPTYGTCTHLATRGAKRRPLVLYLRCRRLGSKQYRCARYRRRQHHRWTRFYYR
jgi:hypothetical protein